MHCYPPNSNILRKGHYYPQNRIIFLKKAFGYQFFNALYRNHFCKRIETLLSACCVKNLKIMLHSNEKKDTFFMPHHKLLSYVYILALLHSICVTFRLFSTYFGSFCILFTLLIEDLQHAGVKNSGIDGANIRML